MPTEEISHWKQRFFTLLKNIGDKTRNFFLQISDISNSVATKSTFSAVSRVQSSVRIPQLYSYLRQNAFSLHFYTDVSQVHEPQHEPRFQIFFSSKSTSFSHKILWRMIIFLCAKLWDIGELKKLPWNQPSKIHKLGAAVHFSHFSNIFICALNALWNWALQFSTFHLLLLNHNILLYQTSFEGTRTYTIK